MDDLVVLGGGSGGRTVAELAARLGAKVALIEPDRRDGAWSGSACVASKALIRAAFMAHQARQAGRFGIKLPAPEVDFAAVMARVRSVAARPDPFDALRAVGIAVYRGAPAFEAYDTVVIDGKTRVQGHKFVIATGSRPAIPEIPGLTEAGFLTDETIWELDELPATLVILGAGPTAVEFAQAFQRLGSQVKLLTDSAHILPAEDDEVAGRVAMVLAAEGITIKTNAEITSVGLRDGRKVVGLRDRATRDTFEAAGTHVLVVTGRLANVEGLELEAAGIHADGERGIEVDDHLQTDNPRIYAIGAVLQRADSVHGAEREAAVAFQNALLRIPRPIHYDTLPRVTFTDPEVASVGLTEDDALTQHPEARVFRAELAELDRARIDGRTDGFAKVSALPSGKVLGATVVGPEAALVLQDFVGALEHGLSLKDIAGTVHAYPTYGGLGHRLALDYEATRFAKGLIPTALRWLLGYQPRSRPEEPAQHAEPHRAHH